MRRATTRECSVLLVIRVGYFSRCSPAARRPPFLPYPPRRPPKFHDSRFLRSCASPQGTSSGSGTTGNPAIAGYRPLGQYPGGSWWSAARFSSFFTIWLLRTNLLMSAGEGSLAFSPPLRRFSLDYPLVDVNSARAAKFVLRIG